MRKIRISFAHFAFLALPLSTVSVPSARGQTAGFNSDGSAYASGERMQGSGSTSQTTSSSAGGESIFTAMFMMMLDGDPALGKMTPNTLNNFKDYPPRAVVLVGAVPLALSAATDTAYWAVLGTGYGLYYGGVYATKALKIAGGAVAGGAKATGAAVAHGAAATAGFISYPFRTHPPTQAKAQTAWHQLNCAASLSVSAVQEFDASPGGLLDSDRYERLSAQASSAFDGGRSKVPCDQGDDLKFNFTGMMPDRGPYLALFKEMNAQFKLLKKQRKMLEKAEKKVEAAEQRVKKLQGELTGLAPYQNNSTQAHQLATAPQDAPSVDKPPTKKEKKLRSRLAEAEASFAQANESVAASEKLMETTKGALAAAGRDMALKAQENGVVVQNPPAAAPRPKADELAATTQKTSRQEAVRENGQPAASAPAAAPATAAIPRASTPIPFSPRVLSGNSSGPPVSSAGLAPAKAEPASSAEPAVADGSSPALPASGGRGYVQAVPETLDEYQRHVEAAQTEEVRPDFKAAYAEWLAAARCLPKDDVRRVAVTVSLGDAASQLGLTEKAKFFYLRAIRFAKEHGYSEEPLADAYMGLGQCLEAEKNADLAVQAYRSAYQIEQRDDNRRWLKKRFVALNAPSE